MSPRCARACVRARRRATTLRWWVRVGCSSSSKKKENDEEPHRPPHRRREKKKHRGYTLKFFPKHTERYTMGAARKHTGRFHHALAQKNIEASLWWIGRKNTEAVSPALRPPEAPVARVGAPLGPIAPRRGAATLAHASSRLPREAGPRQPTASRAPRCAPKAQHIGLVGL